jgi:adenylate cyclase
VTGINFEAEGLLEGVQGGARKARRQLLEELADEGVPLDELRKAVEEDRLMLLPVERALSGENEGYTQEEVAAETGVEVEFLQRQLQALGLAPPDPRERVLSEVDLEAARRLKQFLDAGLDEEGVLETARVIGMTMSQLAQASRDLIGKSLLEPGDNERELAMRYAAAARGTTPLLMRSLEYVFRRHLLESLRQAWISETERSAGQLAGSQEVAVGFADLVGFTSLGEILEVGEVGELSSRLTKLASEVAKPPVRLVKLIGDAAMLVSTDAAPLLDGVLDLVELAEKDERLPSLKAGVAHGDALAHGGDWYGRPVNLAARITAVARPGSVLAANEVADQVDAERYQWSRAGLKSFKGISGSVGVMRVRRAEAGDPE